MKSKLKVFANQKLPWGPTAQKNSTSIFWIHLEINPKVSRIMLSGRWIHYQSVEQQSITGNTSSLITRCEPSHQLVMLLVAEPRNIHFGGWPLVWKSQTFTEFMWYKIRYKFLFKINFLNKAVESNKFPISRCDICPSSQNNDLHWLLKVSHWQCWAPALELCSRHEHF